MAGMGIRPPTFRIGRLWGGGGVCALEILEIDRLSSFCKCGVAVRQENRTTSPQCLGGDGCGQRIVMNGTGELSLSPYSTTFSV